MATADEPVVPPQGIELWRYQGRQSLHRVLCSPGAHGGMVYGLEVRPPNAERPATVVWRRDVGDLVTLVLRALAQPAERWTEALVEYPSGSLLLFRWVRSRLRTVRAGNHAPERAAVVWHGSGDQAYRVVRWETPGDVRYALEERDLVGLAPWHYAAAWVEVSHESTLRPSLAHVLEALARMQRRGCLLDEQHADAAVVPGP